MSFILAATDFSETGNHAVIYAGAFARAYGLEMVVAHSFTVPVAFDNIPVQVIPVDEARQWAEEKMGYLISNIKELYPDVPVIGKVEYGEMVEVLTEAIDERPDPLLVILGNSTLTEGAHFLDSNMMDAFHNLKVPVLATPPGTGFSLVTNLCITLDNDPRGVAHALEQLDTLIGLTGAQLDVLISEKDVQDRDNMPDVNSQISDALKHIHPHYHYGYQSSIEDMVDNFLKAHATDWLVVVPRHHSLVSGLFHKSHTRALAHHVNIPLLVLHEHH